MTRAKYVDWIEKQWGIRVLNPDAKQHRSVTVPEVEIALKKFVLTYQHQMILSDLMLIEKAKAFAKGLGVSPETLQFSHG
ncbi:1736_t:CDS:2, partial [Dentiscutata heterogama]